jgi:hypothetical protein
MPCCLRYRDLRHDPLEVRKATLASIVAKASPGIRFNEHIKGDGPTVFAHACKLWCDDGAMIVTIPTPNSSIACRDVIRRKRALKTGASFHLKADTLRMQVRRAVSFPLTSQWPNCRGTFCRRIWAPANPSIIPNTAIEKRVLVQRTRARLRH